MNNPAGSTNPLVGTNRQYTEVQSQDGTKPWVLGDSVVSDHQHNPFTLQWVGSTGRISFLRTPTTRLFLSPLHQTDCPSVSKEISLLDLVSLSSFTSGLNWGSHDRGRMKVRRQFLPTEENFFGTGLCVTFTLGKPLSVEEKRSLTKKTYLRRKGPRD